jgi:hypothetical protein
MLKNILKLDGAQKLSNNEQKSINGGIGKCNPIIPSNGLVCPVGYLQEDLGGGVLGDFCYPTRNPCK